MFIAICIFGGLCAVLLVVLVFALAKISRYGDDMEEKLLKNLDETLRQREEEDNE